MKGLKLAVVFALCSGLVVGCGNSSNNGGTNNGGTNNGATNNGATNNGTTANNGSTANATNNGATNNGTTANNGQTTAQNNGALPEEPYITEFTYYEEVGEGFTGTKEGLVVGILGKQISNLAGNTKSLEQVDVDAFVDAHLQTATIDAMRGSWDCPPAADPGEGTIQPPRWFFEARIQDGGNTRHPQNITGCYEAGDTAITDIIDAMDELGRQYDIMR